ncbi:Hypothetical predicted protein [Pelobates cultripes]|uniref:Uncharacterized protein n=1 Tax=Pelobates cultripes TaxID=61616 RepID=A0AAD1R495_PELCU|nr:Hypothetical predicted protein [Pelobates cultripes]
MPFFQPQRLQKRRRKIRAYYTPTIPGLEDLLSGYPVEHIDTSCAPDLSTALTHMPTMGRRSQKPQASAINTQTPQAIDALNLSMPMRATISHIQPQGARQITPRSSFG